MNVIARLQFPGLHNWPAAISDVGYLAAPHRHVFHVEAGCEVGHTDRAVEFILLQNELRHFIDSTYARLPCGAYDLGATSCEALAASLVAELGLSWCSVFEDGENGALVEQQPRPE